MKHLIHFFFILTLLIALFFRLQTISEVHSLEYDTEAMLKNSERILEFGSIPDREPLRYAGYFEGGWDNREVLPLTPYVITALTFGNKDNLKAAGAWYPVLFGMLSIIVVAYIGRELFGDIGLIAGSFLGAVPGYLFRTMAGFCDKEAVAMLLVGLALYFYIYAVKRKSYLKALLSGLAFGVASLAWGGYHLYVLPLAVFATVLAFLGETKRSAMYLPVLVFIPFSVLTAGGSIFETYYGFVYIGAGAFVLLNHLFGNSIASSNTGKYLTDKLGVINKFEKTFNVKISRGAVYSLALSGILAGVLLYIVGKDPIFFLLSFIRYAQDPVRGGVHAMSVAEQQLPEHGVWGREMNAMQLVMPFSYFLDPTKSLLFLMIASFPLTLVIAWRSCWKLEYMFVSILVFCLNFIAATSVRLFFPLMPAVCLAAAGVIAYHCTSNSEILRTIGYLLAISLFVILCIQANEYSKLIHTPMDSKWYASLIWYKYNSQELSPLATWWDYGYWIYNVADRPSLADGSNAYYPPDVDLGLMFTETDESLVEKYLRSKNTTSVTVDATMIGKFYWISSIGRGSGNGYGFGNFYYKGTAKTDKGPVRIYDDGTGGQIIITNEGVLIGKNGQFVLIELVATEKGYILQIENATQPHFSGAALLSENFALYVPSQGVNALFVKMFLLNGAGLDRFEKTYDNSMVKTFRLKSTVS